MNVTARASLSVILNVSMNVRLHRERQHKHETQRAANIMVWNVIPRNHNWIRFLFLTKAEINYEELSNACLYHNLNVFGCDSDTERLNIGNHANNTVVCV